MSWEQAPRFTLRRNALYATELKTSLRAHIVLDATIEWTGPPKFFGQVFWSRISGLWQRLLRREEILATLRVRSAQTA